ncbi:MAG TPA: four helix bundle protein [Chthoniobacterales bacterium]|nr:four helix bundle protein [Chthoniobacterales bacterium]
MKTYFDHEKLDVYQQALQFCTWAGNLITEISGKASAKDQLDRASTSIPINIAEGNGKFSNADRSRYLEIARGSALECAGCLDVLVARSFTSADHITPGKEQLVGIVKMLMGLLKRFSDRADFLREDESGYGGLTAFDQDQDQDQEQDMKASVP